MTSGSGASQLSLSALAESVGVSADSGEIRPVVNPSNGSELGRVAFNVPEDMDELAARARAAGSVWSRTPYLERAAVIRRLGQILEERREEVESGLILESGSVQAKASIEVSGSIQECYEASGIASKPLGEVIRSRLDRQSSTRRVPLGVVGVITPFNFPLYLALRAVAPALALGNAVLLKPDHRTPFSGGLLIEKALQLAGLPEDVLVVANGEGDVGSAIVSASAVDMVAFTGSTSVGRGIAQETGRLLKRAHLELGGNSPAIVTQTADVASAAQAGAWGSFGHQGQVCMSTGRHIVHEDIVDEYESRLAAIARALDVGDAADPSTDVGPIIDRHQLERVDSLVGRSEKNGARLIAGGGHSDLFYEPTVLRVDGPDDPCFSNEVFGPVAPILSYGSVDEAVTIVNTDPSGLSASVMAGDVREGMAIADRIESGIAHVNDHTLNDESVAPFGGWKNSGWGGATLGGTSNLEAFTALRWLTARDETQPTPFASAIGGDVDR